MPIRPENRDRYPSNWPEIRARILTRARYKCERCGVPDHALGGRTAHGEFWPAWAIGERMLSLEWPKPGTMAQCGIGNRVALLRVVRIVLTVAHLDHTPENCSDENLLALCQQCHNRLDAPMRRAGIAARARQQCALGDFFERPA